MEMESEWQQNNNKKKTRDKENTNWQLDFVYTKIDLLKYHSK